MLNFHIIFAFSKIVIGLPYRNNVFVDNSSFTFPVKCSKEGRKEESSPCS
jgi:hypothetical protein